MCDSHNDHIDRCPECYEYGRWDDPVECDYCACRICSGVCHCEDHERSNWQKVRCIRCLVIHHRIIYGTDQEATLLTLSPRLHGRTYRMSVS
jgi:hypothetical protein